MNKIDMNIDHEAINQSPWLNKIILFYLFHLIKSISYNLVSLIKI